MYYQVNPRYTCGSPAMVPEDIALKVAKEEREGYQDALTGIYGDEAKHRAESLGLDGIALRYVCKYNKLHYYDLITNRKTMKMDVLASDLQKGDKILRGLDGIIGVVLKSSHNQDHWRHGITDVSLIVKTDTSEIMMACKPRKLVYIEREGSQVW